MLAGPDEAPRTSEGRATAQGPRICLISLSRIADDPRVRRHGETLARAGFEVCAIGAAGARSTSPTWPIADLSMSRERDGRARRLLAAGRARRGPGQALAAYWASPLNQSVWEQTKDLAADLYIANDWPVLPMAQRLAERHGGAFAYDTHEFAAEEHADRLKWRLLSAPYVRAIESSIVHDAAAVMTVSDGIADALQETLNLVTRPTVVRNVADHAPLTPRPVGDNIEFLYHGLLAPDRGVEQLVKSVPAWRQDRHLVIRGVGAGDYIDRLKRLAAGSERIRFDPPALPGDLVGLAHLSDVGVHAGVGTSRQVRFWLPNKFFEYLCAGLAVCVSDLPELRRLVDEHGVGITLSGTRPEQIANDINQLDHDSVNEFKRRATTAARSLSWKEEQRKLLDFVKIALG